MRHEKGGSSFPLIVIFGVFLAFMVTFIFISIYSQQGNARVDEAARDLAEDLARTAFLATSSGHLTPLDLPGNLAGSSYSVGIVDNSAFLVSITTGRRAGSSYSAVANVTLSLDGTLSAGSRIYFLKVGSQLIVSDRQMQVAAENVVAAPSGSPPQFYNFAKSNPKEAAGIMASFFHLLEVEPGASWNILTYRWDGGSLVTQAAAPGKSSTLRASGAENTTDVGFVDNSWVVSAVENAENIGSFTSCPSAENAYLGGWLYSQDIIMEHLRSRSWKRLQDNAIVTIPATVNIRAAAVTTNVSTYPAWKVAFEGQTIFYRAIPWWEQENTPGFLFQSSPSIYPVV
ncbi:MAG: hypothetical protein AB1305_02230 [Candidatus Hadarchaeota archaeon]